MCDVADDYLVSEVFDESPVVYAAMPGLTIPLETAGTSLNDPLLSPNESIISGRHDSGYRSKRRRYTFSSLRITDSPSFSAQNTPPARSPQSQCRGAYDLNGQGTRPKTLNSNDSGLSHISPELMPYFKSTMAQNTSGERTNNVMQTTPSSEAWARIGSQEHSSPALTCLPMQPSSPNIDCDMDSVPQQRPPPSLEQATSTATAPAAKSLELAHSVATQTASAVTTVTSTPVVPAATIAAATAPVSKGEEVPVMKECSPTADHHNAHPALIKRLSDSPIKSADVARKSPQPSAPAASDNVCVAEPMPAQTEAQLDIKPSLQPVEEPPVKVAESVISISSHGTGEASEADSDSSEEESGSSSEESDEESESSSSGEEESDTKVGDAESADMEVDEVIALDDETTVTSEPLAMSAPPKVTPDEDGKNKVAVMSSLTKSTTAAVAPVDKVSAVAPAVDLVSAPAAAAATTAAAATPPVAAAVDLPTKPVATAVAAPNAPSGKDSSESDSETDSESEDETESDSSDEESDSAALNSIRALAGKPAEAKGNAVAKPPVAKVAVARPPPAGKGATKVDDPSAKPSVVPKRKIQLKTKIAAGSSSDSSDDLDSDIASDSGPKQRPKPPALSLPTANRRSSGLIDLVKSQRSALGRESPGIMSISQMASAKPYDDIRKTMARFAAARVSQSIPPTPTTAMPQTPHTAGIAPKQASSESDSSSDSDSDSSSDDDEDVTLEVKPSLKETPAPVKRNRAIRFAGVNTPSASAKARRRKSTLLNL
ncbi:hypothetical protein GGI08_006928 [Coemansia sp. S2]|nr:hypothetical protein GGI08_006928 [Coemansia sp. S2]